MTPEKIIADVLRREAGYVDHPADRGGPTKFGVTAETLGSARKLGRPASADEVKALTEDEARRILTDEFMVQPGFGEILDFRLRALLVDSSVHSGPGTATRFLQKALGVVADGRCGPVTLTAANNTDQVALYYRVVAQRLKHLGRIFTDDAVENAKPKGLRLQAENAAGWMNRMAEFLES